MYVVNIFFLNNQRQYLKINHFYINIYVYICSFHYKCLIVFNLYYRLLVSLQRTEGRPTPAGLAPVTGRSHPGSVRGPAPKGSRQLSADECI